MSGREPPSRTPLSINGGGDTPCIVGFSPRPEISRTHVSYQASKRRGRVPFVEAGGRSPRP